MSFIPPILGSFICGPREPPRDFVILDTTKLENDSCITMDGFIAACYYTSSGGSNKGKDGTQNFGELYSRTNFPIFGMDNSGHLIKMSDLIKGTRWPMYELLIEYFREVINFDLSTAEFGKLVKANFVKFYNIKNTIKQLFDILTSYYFNRCQVIISIVMAELTGKGYWVENSEGSRFALFMKSTHREYEQLTEYVQSQLSQAQPTPIISTKEEMIELLISTHAQFTDAPIEDIKSIDKMSFSDNRTAVMNFDSLIPTLNTMYRGKVTTASLSNYDSVLDLLKVMPISEIQKKAAENDYSFKKIMTYINSNITDSKIQELIQAQTGKLAGGKKKRKTKKRKTKKRKTKKRKTK